METVDAGGTANKHREEQTSGPHLKTLLTQALALEHQNA